MINNDEFIAMIPMDEIHADADFNCRGDITPLDVVDLVKDIQNNGLIQPVSLALLPEGHPSGKKYKLLAGFRRHMAHRVMAASTIKALVKTKQMSDAEQQFINLAENLQRKQLTLAQEARSMKRLHDLGIGQFTIAERTGMSRGWVQVRMMFLDLPLEIQNEIELNSIGQTEIRQLHTIHKNGSKEQMEMALKKIKKAKITGTNTAAAAKKLAADVAPPAEKFDRTGKSNLDLTTVNLVMDHMQNTIGNGLHTRVLAYLKGTISISEMLDSIADYADTNGISYTKPTAQEWDMLSISDA